MKLWYNQVKGYSFAAPSLDSDTDTFTQVIREISKDPPLGQVVKCPFLMYLALLCPSLRSLHCTLLHLTVYIILCCIYITLLHLSHYTVLHYAVYNPVLLLSFYLSCH